MKLSPTIDFKEFEHYTIRKREVNGFHETIRRHPDFGHWRERTFTMNHIRIYEHRAELVKPVNVQFEEVGLGKYVHHCISLEGNMGAYFSNNKLSANLTQHRYHTLYIPENEYLLGFGKVFTNVHIEIDRDHFANLLCESERWSSELRKRIFENEIFYPGECVLTPGMIHTLHDIFNSTLSGSLKRLLIEAKVHELVALQLGNFSEGIQPVKQRSSHRDLFYSIYDYLAARFLEAHSLKDIARNFGINEFALKKGFRENFQTTVFDFLLSKRLEHAREQLLHTDLTVQKISSLVGYKYPNHFSSAFKKKFGILPSSLKK
jgi:AraC-like DNA-binding protein